MIHVALTCVTFPRNQRRILIVNINLLWLIAGTFAALSIGTAIRLVAIRNSAAEVVQARIGSLKVWWVLAVLWSVAVLCGQMGTAVMLAIASFLALREYLPLVGTTAKIGRVAIASLLICSALHYALIVSGAGQAAKWYLPIVALLVLSSIRAATCDKQNFIRLTAGAYWGVMLLVYALSHALFLFEIESPQPVVGKVGWFLFLILITESNDIAQALVGRKIGKHKITPQVSPHKTVEGFLGGIACSIVLSIALAPYLTTMMEDRSRFAGISIAALAGILLSIVGFMGDINMSAIKRDAGVKDGSSLLPGMGGIIDRIDSLVFNAPVFYYFVLLMFPTHHSV
jgi:phosphatidate cytidylyltransferase